MAIGTDPVLQTRANHKRAQRVRALSNELDVPSIEELEHIDSSYAGSVRVLHHTAGTPQRDEIPSRSKTLHAGSTNTANAPKATSSSTHTNTPSASRTHNSYDWQA